jgi:hypothetical protein
VKHGQHHLEHRVVRPVGGHRAGLTVRPLQVSK